MTAEQLEAPFITPDEAQRIARAEARRAAQHPPNPRAALDEVTGRMAAFQSRTVAEAEARAAAAQQLRAELLARCPDQARALQAAAGALAQAESDLAQAAQAVASFEGSAPASRDQVQAWAAELARRRAERDGLALLAEKAREQHQAAGAALRRALLAARDAEARQLRAELDQRKAATDAQIAALRAQIAEAAQAHNEAAAAPGARLLALEALGL